MTKVIAIAVAVLVFLAVVAFTLIKLGWIAVSKIAETKKFSVAWEGPKAKITKKTEEVAA